MYVSASARTGRRPRKAAPPRREPPTYIVPSALKSGTLASRRRAYETALGVRPALLEQARPLPARPAWSPAGSGVGAAAALGLGAGGGDGGCASWDTPMRLSYLRTLERAHAHQTAVKAQRAAYVGELDALRPATAPGGAAPPPPPGGEWGFLFGGKSSPRAGGGSPRAAAARTGGDRRRLGMLQEAYNVAAW